MTGPLAGADFAAPIGDRYFEDYVPGASYTYGRVELDEESIIAFSPASSLGSPGCDELRWLAPVRPGDSLAVRFEILSARRSRSKPDRGLVSNQLEVLNQRDDVVMTLKTVLLLRARHAEP